MEILYCKKLLYEPLDTGNWQEKADAVAFDSRWSFEVNPEIIEEGNELIVQGFLTNPTEEEIEIVVLESREKGFGIDFITTPEFKYVGPRFPPAPPRPIKLTIPPSVKVEFKEYIQVKEKQIPGMPMPGPSPDAGLRIWDYEYTGSSIVELQWVLRCWHDPSPSGIINLKLPER